MDIQYLGHSSFRIKGKTATIITDPFDADMVGVKYPKQKADIVTTSHDHKDHNQTDRVDVAKKVIPGPGEYDISDVSIIGIPSYHDDKKGKERGKNTIFVFEIDGLRVAHLGDLGHELKEKHLNRMGAIDILMVPVGGHFTVGPKEAAEVVRTLEPSIVIPMHFLTPKMDKKNFGDLEKLDPFLKEMNLSVEETEKLSVKPDSLGEEQKIVVLELSN